MSFAWPLILLSLFAMPLIGGLYWAAQRRRSNYTVKFTNLDLLANVVNKTPAWRRHVPPALYLLALAALVFAIARPESTSKIPREEATVIMVMDVSGSMNATDISPTRLAAAKESARLLVEDLPPKFQIALIAFSSNVRTVVAPTNDKEKIYQGLESLIAVSGTAMGDAIMQAVDLAITPPAAEPSAPGAVPVQPTPTAAVPNGGASARADNKRPPAVIVLLSDGKNSAGLADPVDAANYALEKGIPIFTIALGTPAGVVDITQNGVTRRIPVPQDEATLKSVSEITGGSFFDAPSAKDLKQVYKDLGSKIGFINGKKEVTVWFALTGLLLMLAGGMSSLYWFNRFP